MSDCYCILADIGLSTQNQGGISICNQSREYFMDTDDQLISLNTHKIEDAWNSPTRKDIVDCLKSGIRHKNCISCWDEEDAGRGSKRILSNQMYADVRPLSSQPRTIMLKPGNACNLGCRHCTPFTSSRLVKEYFKVESNITDYSIYQQQFASSKDSYSISNPFWNTLTEWSENIIFFEIYGAEPTIIDPMWSAIKRSSDSPNAGNISFYMNTNGTVWREDFFEIFSKLKDVRIAFSIDATEGQFEYMRYPAKWDKLLDIIDKYKQLTNELSNITLDITVTVSILNVYYSYEIFDQLNRLDLTRSVGFNIVHQPSHLNMRIIPDDVKRIITDKLISESNASEMLTNFLNIPIENSQEQLKNFWRITQGYDNLRGESYKTTFPEMYKLLEPYLDI